MFQEIIYTRCGYGFNILKNGEPITTNGLKIYNCTTGVYANEPQYSSKLHFLVNETQTEQSHDDPSFMEEAYLFYTPDVGEPFLINYHPIHFDRDEAGNISNRGGNFVNHTIIGDFTEFYPFETFGDDSIWTAKAVNENQYYREKPIQSAGREDISAPCGKYSVEQIKIFIQDGREEALAKAVSFLIKQFQSPAESRKYLIIKDDGEEKLELWIAAIELSMSPRMASGLSFATRMAYFQNRNKYTVNQSGEYQSQMNLQNPGQKLRYRSMIVGVNMRDHKNNAVPHNQSSPYEILDGTTKKALFDAEIEDPYYSFITRFSDDQTYFCREFLQMLDISQPSDVSETMYSVFKWLQKADSLEAKQMLSLLSKIEQYHPCRTRAYDSLYKDILQRVPAYLSKDPASAVKIMGWVLNAARIVGDDQAEPKLKRQISNTLADELYQKGSSDALEMWAGVKSCSFSPAIAKYLTDDRVLNHYANTISALPPTSIFNIARVFTDAASMAGTPDKEKLKSIFRICVNSLKTDGDASGISELQTILSKVHGVNPTSFFWELATEQKNNLDTFVLAAIIENDPVVVSSESNMTAISKFLVQGKMLSLAQSLMNRYVSTIQNEAKLLDFAQRIEENKSIPDAMISGAYSAVDRALKPSVLTKATVKIASCLQSADIDTALPNSAHIMALGALNNRGKNSLIDAWTPYVEQGFPHVNDAEYIQQLSDALAAKNFDEKTEEYICEVLMSGPEAYITAYLARIIRNAEKQPDRWNIDVSFFAQMEPEDQKKAIRAISTAIIKEEMPYKRSEKLSGFLDRKAAQLFNKADSEADKKMQSLGIQRDKGSSIFSFFKKK